MSHGAKPVAVALGVAAFLSAGVAMACPAHKEHTASLPTDSVVTTTQPSTQGPVGGVRG
jgi:hypothetical protein